MMNNPYIRLFFRHYAAFLISLILTWSVSFLVILNTHYVPSALQIWGIGVFNEVLFSSFAILLLVPFFLIPKLRVVRALIFFFLVTAVLFEMVSSFYYNITLSPVDNTIFMIDRSQVGMIAGDFVVFKWFYLLLVIPILAYSFLFKSSKDLLEQNGS